MPRPTTLHRFLLHRRWVRRQRTVTGGGDGGWKMEDGHVTAGHHPGTQPAREEANRPRWSLLRTPESGPSAEEGMSSTVKYDTVAYAWDVTERPSDRNTHNHSFDVHDHSSSLLQLRCNATVCDDTGTMISFTHRRRRPPRGGSCRPSSRGHRSPRPSQVTHQSRTLSTARRPSSSPPPVLRTGSRRISAKIQKAPAMHEETATKTA